MNKRKECLMSASNSEFKNGLLNNGDFLVEIAGIEVCL
jgi:hypothetical protein